MSCISFSLTTLVVLFCTVLKDERSQTILNPSFFFQHAFLKMVTCIFDEFASNRRSEIQQLSRYNAYSNINDKVSVMTEMTNDNMHINKHQATFNHCPIFLVMLKDNVIFKCSTSQRRYNYHQITSITWKLSKKVARLCYLGEGVNDNYIFLISLPKDENNSPPNYCIEGMSTHAISSHFSTEFSNELN